MNRGTTIALTISALILALSVNWIVDWIRLTRIFEPDVEPYSGGKCRRIEGVEACEDIIIHHRTGFAFMACGNGTFRRQVYYPPFDPRNFSELPEVIREPAFIYNINNDKLTPIEFKDFPPEEDLILHGLGFYEDEKNEPNKLYMFLINHRRTGSVVEIFEHILNTKVLTHLSTVKHDLIHHPNNIAPVSKDEFYVTNFRYSDNFYLHQFEALTRRPWGDIVFHSSSKNITEIVADKIQSPNGIDTNWDHSKVYVATTTGGDVLIYDRKSNNKLHLSESVFTGLCMDNLNVDEEGEIYVSASQKPLLALSYISDKTGSAPPYPVAVIKVSNNTAEDKFYGVKYSHQIIFEDNGSILGAVTVSAVNKQRNVMLLGSLAEEGVGRCELD